MIEHTSWALRGFPEFCSRFDRYECAAADSSCRLAVVDSKLGELIGTIGFHTMSAMNRSAELAFDFAPTHWGRGIASAMCSTVTQWSYQMLNLVRVQATVLETNAASERVLRKSGFTCEGLLRSYRMVRGSPGNFKMYSRLVTDGAGETRYREFRR